MKKKLHQFIEKRIASDYGRIQKIKKIKNFLQSQILKKNIHRLLKNSSGSIIDPV